MVAAVEGVGASFPKVRQRCDLREAMALWTRQGGEYEERGSFTPPLFNDKGGAAVVGLIVPRSLWHAEETAARSATRSPAEW